MGKDKRKMKTTKGSRSGQTQKLKVTFIAEQHAVLYILCFFVKYLKHCVGEFACVSRFAHYP